MKRTFTFLLTALFLCMGMTVKADIAQKWEKTTAWKTEGFDVPDGVTAVAGNFSVALMETSVKVTSTTIGVTFDWGQIGNCALQILGVDLVAENGTIIKSHYLKQVAGGSTDGVYSLTDLTADTEGVLRYFVGYGSDDRLNDTGGNITVTGAEALNQVTVTYEYYLNNQKIHSVEKKHLPDDAFDAPALDFVTFTYGTEGKVTAETTTVRVNCTENLPFAVTTDLDNPVWQVVEMHRYGTFRVWKYEAGVAAVKVEDYLGNKFGTVAENMLWCFVGNLIDGFKIYNKAAGMEKTLNATAGNASVGVAADGNNVWKLAKSTATNEPAACFTNNGSSYMNQSGGKIAYWGDADNGSTCYFYNPADFVSEEVNAIKNIPAGVVGQYVPTAEVKTAFNEAVATFEADKTNIEACLALVGNIADVKASRKIEVAAGNYYIKATGNGNNANWYVTYNAANEFVAAALGAGEELSTKHVWTLETIENEEGYKVKSAGLDKYVNALTAAAGKTPVTSDYAGGAKFTFTDNGLGKLIIKDGNNNVMRTENNGDINYWGSESNETWYLMPIVNEQLLTDFCAAAEAFAALQNEVAFTALVEVSKKWNAANATAAPLLAAIKAGEYVFENEVEAAKQSMATVKEEIEPVLAYFNGDYKTASAKAKAFYGKLAEDSEAYTALAAAIATFEEVADVTTVEALEAKVAALNTVYDEQYAAYDLSEVIEEFSFQAEMFSYYGYDEDLKVFGGLHSTWNSVNSLNEQILEKITAGELVTKGEVEYAMEAMEEADAKIESILAYYTETYKPTLDYAEAILDKYEAESNEYNSLAAVIEASKELTYVYDVSSLEHMVADLKANPVYALYDIDAPITTGEEGWVEACYYVQGEKHSFLPNADLEVEEYEEEGEVITELPGCVYKNVTEMSSGFVVLGAPAELTEANSAAYLRQAAAFDPGQYRLTGKAFDKGVSNAVMFVYDTNTGDTINKVSIAVAGEEFYFEDVVLEFIIDDYLDLTVGYSCKFEEAEAQLVVGGFKLEKKAAVTTTLREQFKEVYQGDMMQGVTGFSMLTNIEPYNMLEAMHPAYDVLYAEVDAIYGAMWEGVPTDTATVAKAIRSMEAMKADFDAVANYLMTDEYWNTTQDALTVIEGYMEESSVYAQLMEAYSAAKGAVYDEEEDELKYYATFTSVADIEAALAALAEALEDAEAKIPTAITLDKEEVVLNGELTVQLTATVEGSETADKSVFWESEDEDVATVDENGLVTVVGKIGGTYITAYSIHKSVYAECYVNVTALPTGIDGFEVKVETVIYDIHGRQVEKMEKGFYIVNGKKMFVK